jgi:outer membrane protein OmpA-like peptidoglycan-associated protein
MMMERRKLTLLLVTGLLASRAHAQKANTDTQLFRPPATSGGILGLDSAFVGPHLRPAFSLFAVYSNQPLVLLAPDGSHTSSVIEHQVDLQAALSLSLWRHLEIGVLVPAVVYQTTHDDPLLTQKGLTQAALGDVRVEAKVFFGAANVRGGRQIGFGAAASLGVPSGDDNAFYSDDSVTFRPRLMMSGRLHPVEFTLQVGAVIRDSRSVADLHIGQQLSYGVGLRFNLVAGLNLAGTVAGLYGLTGTSNEPALPVEFLVGPEYRFSRVPFEIVLAAGRGLTDGYGAPNARALFALRYQPRPSLDRDGDGVFDDRDRCPDVAGLVENQGCPDVDSDGDEIVDRIDRCPLEPGPPENQGCPWPDSDGDGVPDKDDLCPKQPGPRENLGCPDKDSDGDGLVDRLDKCPKQAGPKENQGCPWPDRDGDGIPDKDDKCPTVFGVKENQGCPEVDTDGDGIIDRLDKCPFEKENFNGFEDEDGCPDKGPELAVLTEKSIQIKQVVQFETKKAKILPKSYRLLAAVAAILTLHPEITKIRIEGHTDTQGGHSFNVKLSQARADAVRDHLINMNGIDGSRLEAQGFAYDRPIADNKHSAGRAKNRRVEFNIVDKKAEPAPLPPSLFPQPPSAKPPAPAPAPSPPKPEPVPPVLMPPPPGL